MFKQRNKALLLVNNKIIEKLNFIRTNFEGLSNKFEKLAIRAQNIKGILVI